MLKYVKGNDSLIFTLECFDITESDYIKQTAESFIKQLSTEFCTFMSAYRFGKNEAEEFLKNTKVSSEFRISDCKYNSFFRITDASVNSVFFTEAVEMYFFFFFENTDEERFAEMWPLSNKEQLIKEKKLAGYFISGDCGSDFYIGFHSDLSEKAELLYDALTKSGYNVIQR